MICTWSKKGGPDLHCGQFSMGSAAARRLMALFSASTDYHHRIGPSMSDMAMYHQSSWPERYEWGVYTMLSPAVFSPHFRRSMPLMSSQTVNSNAPGTMNAGSQLAL